jgi:hypothetical protein
MNRSKWLKLTVAVLALTTVTVFAQSQPARWQKLLGNMMLSNVDAASVSKGGASGQAGETGAGMDLGNLGEMANAAANVSASSTMQLHLCSDKSFVLTSKDSASLPGMTDVSSASKITGLWAITAATQVDAKVKLTPRKASDAKLLKSMQLQNFQVAFTGERTFVNETRWYRMRSSVCKK